MQPLVDSTDPNWREVVRNNILNVDNVIDIKDTAADEEGKEGNEEP